MASRRARQAEIERLFLEQTRDDVLNEFDWISSGIDLTDVGLEEESQQPLFGNTDCEIQSDPCKGHIEGGVQQYVTWFYDGEDSRYECN